MHEAGAGHMRQRLPDGTLDAETVDVAHREDARVELLQQLALALVERADADERDAARHERGQLPAVALEPLSRTAQRGGQDHPVDISARARLRAVQVAVRVEPEDAARAVDAAQAPERAQRDRVVAAEDDRDRPAPGRLRDEVGDVTAGFLDLGQEPRVLVTGLDRLGDRRADVAPVVVGVAEALDPPVEPGIAGCRWPHVDAAPARAEIESGADDGRLAAWLHLHAGQG